MEKEKHMRVSHTDTFIIIIVYLFQFAIRPLLAEFFPTPLRLLLSPSPRIEYTSTHEAHREFM